MNIFTKRTIFPQICSERLASLSATYSSDKHSHPNFFTENTIRHRYELSRSFQPETVYLKYKLLLILLFSLHYSQCHFYELINKFFRETVGCTLFKDLDYFA